MNTNIKPEKPTESIFDAGFNWALERPMEMSYTFPNLRRSDYLLNTDNTLYTAFAKDGATQNTTSTSYVDFTTTATSEFFNCPEQTVGDSLSVKFKVLQRTSVTFMAEAILLADGLTFGDEIDMGLFLNDVVRSPIGKAVVNGNNCTIHFTEQLIPSQYEFKIQYKLAGAAITSAIITGPKLSVSGQYIISV